jgi:hypothetical protein
MKPWMAAAAALALAAGAHAQEGETRKPELVTPPDGAIIQAAVTAIKQPGSCTVIYIISEEGKATDIKPECTPADYADHVTKALEAAEWKPELVEGTPVPSFPQRQTFDFGVRQVAAPASADKPPVATKGMNQRAIALAYQRIQKPGACTATFTVTAEGKPVDIKPSCQPTQYNETAERAIKGMEFEPGTKDGKPVDWPNFEHALAFGG